MKDDGAASATNRNRRTSAGQKYCTRTVFESRTPFAHSGGRAGHGLHALPGKSLAPTCTPDTPAGPGRAGPRGQRRGLPPAGRNTKFDGQNSNFCARNLSITELYRLTRPSPGALAGWRRRGWEGVGTRPNALPWLDGHHLHARTGHLGHHLHAFPDTLDTGVHVRTDVQYFCPLLVSTRTCAWPP